MRSPLATLAAAALLLGACSYDFSNPAEKLDAGEIAGRVVADVSGTGSLEGLGDVSVRLRNGSLDPSASWTTRSNGRFILLGMQPGRHTVLFEKGTNWSITRDVDVAWGADGQPEGVILGDIEIRYPVSIGGRFTVPSSSATVPDKQFIPTGIIAYDEETGLQATITQAAPLPVFSPLYDFDYLFPSLPIGRHRLRFAVVGTELDQFASRVQSTYSFSLSKDVGADQAGVSFSMGTITVAPPPVGAALGKLRFQVSVPATLTVGTTYMVTIQNADPMYAPITRLANPAGAFEEDLPPGAYYVEVKLSPADNVVFFDPPKLASIVTSSQTTELGTIYVVDSSSVAASANACVYSADCYSMYSCVNGTCQFAHVAAPLICYEDASIQTQCQSAMSTCPTSAPYYTSCAGGMGVCTWQSGAPGKWICVPSVEGACQSLAGPVTKLPCP
jgi:hypothetical protein